MGGMKERREKKRKGRREISLIFSWQVIRHFSQSVTFQASIVAITLIQCLIFTQS